MQQQHWCLGLAAAYAGVASAADLERAMECLTQCQQAGILGSVHTREGAVGQSPQKAVCQEGRWRNLMSQMRHEAESTPGTVSALVSLQVDR